MVSLRGRGGPLWLGILGVLVLAAGCTAEPGAPADPASTSAPPPSPSTPSPSTPSASTPSASTPSASTSSGAALPETDLEQAGARVISVTGDWLAAGEGAVWLSGVTLVHRLDPRSGKTVARVPVPQGPCQASVVAFGSLWTATCERPGLARIDPRTNRVAKHLRLDVAGDGEGSIGAGAGAVWVLVDAENCQACRLAEVDPMSMRVRRTVAVTGGAAAVRYGAGSAWVTNPAAGLVEQVDPGRGKVRRRIPVGSNPRFLAVGEGAVWTLNQGDGSVTRVDPTTGDTTEVPVGFAGEGGDATAGGGWVWVRGGSDLLARLDPVEGRVVEKYGPASGSGAVVVGFGAVWVSAHDVDTVWRLPLPPS